MHSITRTFTDFDGNQRTETHYFNLTKAELVELEFRSNGLEDRLTRLVAAQKGSDIMDLITEIIEITYGVKAEGGRFRKGREYWLDFKSSAFYSDFFFEMVTDADKASAFLNAVIPQELRADAQREVHEIRNPERFDPPAPARPKVPLAQLQQPQEQNVFQLPQPPQAHPNDPFFNPTPAPAGDINLDELQSFRAWQAQQAQGRNPHETQS